MFQKLVEAASIFPMVTATGWISGISPGVNEEVYDSSRTTLPEPTRFQFREGAGGKTKETEKAPADSRRRKLGEFSTGHATDAFKVSERRRRKGLEDQPLNGHTPDTLEIIIGSFPEKVNDPLRDQLRWPIILTILLLCLSLVGLSV